MNLADVSLPYRRPELYDELHHDPDDTAARQQEAFIDHHQPAAKTVLDLGCGTGRDLAYHARRFTCTGVDLQPQMVDYARRQHPHVDLHVGDIRMVRLGRTFDVILSVGLTPSYLLHDTDLTAAFSTFAAHAHPGSLLILQPLQTVPDVGERTFRINTPSSPGQVTVNYSVDPDDSSIVIMNRTWRLNDATLVNDRICRRILTRATIDRHLATTGFVRLAHDPSNADGYVVAQQERSI